MRGEGERAKGNKGKLSGERGIESALNRMKNKKLAMRKGKEERENGVISWGKKEEGKRKSGS